MKLTLREAWEKCMSMWDDMVDYEGYGDERKDKYAITHPELLGIFNQCYFCEYSDHTSCRKCPPLLIDPTFHCKNADYHFHFHPVNFYMEIKTLYLIACKMHNWEPIKLKH